MWRHLLLVSISLAAIVGCDRAGGRSAKPSAGLRTAEETREAPAEATIVKVLTIWQAQPSIIDPTDGVTPIGLQLTLYLIDDQQRGVFGDGIIRLRMVVVDRDPTGRVLDRQQVKTWEWTTAQAIPFRSRRVTYLGQGYGLLATWGDVDVLGKEIEVHPEFVRQDNRIVTGAVKSLKIPPPIH
jgi:hypothetical protein